MGGGNSLNIIRIPSKKQWVNIVESDMNGTVDVSSIANRVSRWNYFNNESHTKMTDYTTTQNNINDKCCSSMWYSSNTVIGELAFSYISKITVIGTFNTGSVRNSYYYQSSFRPIIEC